MADTRTLKVTASGDREIVMTRAVDAPRRLAFDAFTRADLVRRWLLGPPGWTMPVCEIDLRVGKGFRYVWRNADGREMGMRGVYREIAPPDRIVHTEIFDEDWTGGETLVTTVFTERGGRTTVTLTVRYSSREARDAVLKSPMAQGMELGYARLDELLAAESAPAAKGSA
jgi:uncharacterized protein YndB with AHSA1/START domain